MDSLSPPSYENLNHHLKQAVLNQACDVPLGSFNGWEIMATFETHVMCAGDGEDNLHNDCLLITERDGVVRERRVYVLGPVTGYGTAVVMDNAGQVWLFNTPNSIDPPLPGLTFKAAVVLRHGETARPDSDMILTDVYHTAQLVNVDDEEEF
jgi:hypothetical protein